jgi:hypothetical protein
MRALFAQRAQRLAQMAEHGRCAAGNLRNAHDGEIINRMQAFEAFGGHASAADPRELDALTQALPQSAHQRGA